MTLALLRNRRSLLRSILWATGSVTLAGLLICASILYLLYVSADERIREATLQVEASRVAAFLANAPVVDGQALDLPEAMFHGDDNEPVHVVVVEASGRVVAAVGGEQGAFWPPTQATEQVYLKRHDPVTGVRQIGLSKRIDLPSRQVWVQIAVAADSDMIFDSLLEEFVLDFGWLLLPFGLIILLTNGYLLYRDLRPLEEVSTRAASINSGTPGVRLPEATVPSEILPLVRAMNGALDRLEEAAAKQRQFIGDVAHEMRSPLAVVRLQLDLMADRETAEKLQRDIEGMERMMIQLLDLARLDEADPGPIGAVDLNEVAREVVHHLAPLVIARNRRITLVQSPQQALVSGCQDQLFRAVRNLAENALSHAPEGSSIHVEVTGEPAIMVRDRGPGISPEQRSRVFNRHWQGRRDRHGGAGLGLAIVARTAAAHGAEVVIDDVSGGGALVGLRFARPAIAP